MALIVQKFGGSSVADAEKILSAARKAIRAQQEGSQVVMVVSAMGKNTDMLVDLAAQINERPPAREMDMLLSTGEQVSVALMAMAIDSLGHKAVSLTGAQIGIKTDSLHTKARIKSISTVRVQQLLDEGNIVIAAGFQGIDEDFNITTLGRGGSDTTAVALAAVLQADACEIFTDVDGVYSTDPRIIPEARHVRRIGYDEMFELASLGAGVMHSRSIEFAKKFLVPIHVRSSFTDSPGSMIVPAEDAPCRVVSGAALTKDEARVTIARVPDVPGTSLELFSRIASRGITVDMIVQNVGEDGKADISFTVPRYELPLTLDAAQEAVDALGSGKVTRDDNVSKVSIVGQGMAKATGVADRAFRVLADEGINIQMITTSEIKISVVVQRIEAQKALRALHQGFGLQVEPAAEMASPPDLPAKHAPTRDVLDVVARLRGVDMEELIIDAITLDESQARLTIRGIPDEPGVAAAVFEDVAAAGIFVDMIVQSYGHADLADLSFTIPADRLDAAIRVLEGLAEKHEGISVSSSPRVAKLSVSGIGLHSRTDVAIRMFRSLSAAGINVALINTSEVRVNVIIDGKQGRDGLKCLHEAFADVLV